MEEVIHHNVGIKNNKTGGPTLAQCRANEVTLEDALGEHTLGYTFSIFEHIRAGHGYPLHKHPFPEFSYVLEGNLSVDLDIGTTRVSLSGTRYPKLERV